MTPRSVVNRAGMRMRDKWRFSGGRIVHRGSLLPLEAQARKTLIDSRSSVGERLPRRIQWSLHAGGSRLQYEHGTRGVVLLEFFESLLATSMCSFRWSCRRVLSRVSSWATGRVTDTLDRPDVSLAAREDVTPFHHPECGLVLRTISREKNGVPRASRAKMRYLC